jgi:hypothetical protein
LRTGHWRVVDAAAEPCESNYYGLIAGGFVTHEIAQQYVDEAKEHRERWRRAHLANADEEMLPESADEQ